MVKTIQKPSFREVVAVTTMNLDDVNLKFNSQRVGPMNFAGLRTANYGPGFRMPTMPELTNLVYASLEHQNKETAKNVVETLRNHWLTGDTGILYTKDGMFVQDNPGMTNGRVVMNQKTLERKLGKHEERGVTFSNDGSLRFTPYGFKRESQTASELAKNSGVIALVGSEENAEKLAKSSQHYRVNPYFWVLSKVENPETRVAGLDSSDFDDRLDVGADDSEDNGNRYSFGVFGVSEGAAGAAPKK